MRVVTPSLVLVALAACGGAAPRTASSAAAPEPTATSPAAEPAPTASVAPCRDTESCRAQQERDEEALAQAIAAEPPSTLLSVARVAADVLVAPEAGIALALREDSLVAIDTQDGHELWRLRGIALPGAGYRQLDRLGPALIVHDGASMLRIALRADLRLRPAAPHACTFPLPVSFGAEASADLSYFVRADQPYAHWVLAPVHVPTGTPMAPSPLPDRYECGIVRLDVAACTASAEDASAFVLGISGAPARTTGVACTSQVVPPLVATRAPLSTAARLRVEEASASQCGVSLARTLVSDDPAWSAPLDPRPFPCPVPAAR